MNIVKRLYLPIKYLVVFGILLFSFFLYNSSASAVTGSEWQAGRIIDDTVFINKDSMTPQQIQDFLNAKLPTCDTNGTQSVYDSVYKDTVSRATYGARRGNPIPFTCITQYYENPDTKQNNYGSTTIPVGARSAAQLIWEAGQAYNISPKVLLVTLQKEQGLITDDWPFKNQFLYAMGAYCPDSGPGGSANCDPAYAGFGIQMKEAASLLRYYLDNMTQPWWTYKKPGNNYILWNVSTTNCGGSNVWIYTSATAALYTYTPYQPNQAALNNLYGTGDGCSAYGNRNFWRMFNDWFGVTLLPLTIKGNASGTIYLYMSGYKIAVPSMATLQDYGIHPSSVTTWAQSSVDAIPPPASPISGTLSYLVKSPSDTDADGGAVYLISVGKKYSVVSMDQFNDFGFNVSNIAYLPLGYILSINGSQALSSYLSVPSNLVFQIGASTKRIIFDYNTYKSLNPSDVSVGVSEYVADTIPSGIPISNREILLRRTDGDIYLYNNNQYYSIPNLNTYNCWGFYQSLGTPLYYLPQNNYIGPIASAPNLNCLVNNGAQTYVMNGVNKYLVPTEYGSFGGQVLNADTSSIVSKVPTAASALKRAIKASNSGSIWWLEDGIKKPIPSMSNFNLLGLGSSNVDTIDISGVSSISSNGLKLGSGQAVKTSDGSAVFVVSGSARLLYPTGDDFLAYANSWTDIETYTTLLLDQGYPYGNIPVNKYFYNQSGDNTYLMDKNGCYGLAPSHLTSYAQNQATIASSQSYGINIFPRLNLINCQPASVYVKQPDQSTIYFIDNGQKKPFASWAALVNHSGQTTPYIISLSPSTMAAFPYGQTIN